MTNPILYEINTRVWRHRFGAATRLLDIPTTYWQQLADLGVDYVWLMGVWQTGPNVLHYALEPGLQHEYTQVLPDWKEEDIIGSPYAIDRYVLHQALGKAGDLVILKQRLNELGLRLILDFVPNHFHAESSLIVEFPEIFLEVTAEQHAQDPHTCYSSPQLPGRYFAHGKDPYFPAWQDTAQVNYAQPVAHAFMNQLLLRLAKQCDGLRCDMAMLPFPSVRKQTWGAFLGESPDRQDNFWTNAIHAVKVKHPDFCFLAEVYWDMEWELQQAGFDYTYDKRLLDRLRQPTPQPIHDHLQAEIAYQNASARFLENHDEDRSLSFLSLEQAQAAAVITYTVPGLHFFYQGQWEGRKLRLPVQLGREPLEYNHTLDGLILDPTTALAHLPELSVVDPRISAFYDRLLAFLRQPALKNGQWTMVELSVDLLAWQWQLEEQNFLIVSNYQAATVVFELPNERPWHHFGTNLAADQQQQLLPFGYLLLGST